MKFTPIVNFKKVYQRFLDDVGFTIKMSGTITVALLIIYLIFALILNQIGSLNVLSYLEYFLAIIGICLVLGIVSPFIYSFFAINGGLHSNARDKIKYTSFLKTYLIGTRPPFSGQLRLSMTLLKAICINILLTFLVSIIVYFFSLNSGSELNAIVNEIMAAFNLADSNEALTALENVILNHQEFIKELSLLTTFFPLLIAVYYFLHTVSRNTFKYYLATSLGVRTPKQAVEYIFVRTLRAHRKDYNLNYYYTAFPLTIIFVVSFTLSYFLLGYFGPAQMSISILSLTAIVIGIIASLPFLPIIFNTHEEMWTKYWLLFMGVFLENAEKELAMYKMNNDMATRLGAENLQKAQTSLESLKNNMIEGLKSKGYEDSDFEGLSAEEIYKGYAENDTYAPYRKKMERLKKEGAGQKESNASLDNKESDNSAISSEDNQNEKKE